jgi:hypothetical protein
MLTPFQIPEVEVQEERLIDEVLPKLLGKIFHITSASGLNGIIQEGAILPNADDQFPSTYGQSRNSVGRHINAVCLFDLRDISSEDLQWTLDCFSLGPHSLGDTVVFLFLDQNFANKLIYPSDLDPETRSNGIYIPKSECWYPQRLPLNHVECEMTVKIIRRPPGELELLLQAISTGEAK